MTATSTSQGVIDHRTPRNASEVITALSDIRKNESVVWVYDFTSSVIRSSGLSTSSRALSR